MTGVVGWPGSSAPVDSGYVMTWNNRAIADKWTRIVTGERVLYCSASRGGPSTDALLVEIFKSLSPVISLNPLNPQ